MTIQLAIFDLAGTTVNDPDGVNTCLREALTAAGLAADRETVNAVMGIPKREAIRRLLADASGRVPGDDEVERIHADFEERMSRFYRTDPRVFEIPGTSDVFRRLRAGGIKVAVNTGFSRKIVALILDRLSWIDTGLVDASIASDEVAQGRPHPDMIFSLMDRLGVRDPAQVAKIGDTPADLHEGSNAGCRFVIGVTSGTHTREQLQHHPHTHLVNSVADVPAVLGL